MSPWLSDALLSDLGSTTFLALNSLKEISFSTSSAKDAFDFLPPSGSSGFIPLKLSVYESVGSKSDLIVGS